MAIVNLDKIQAGYNGNLESVVVYTTKAGTTKKKNAKKDRRLFYRDYMFINVPLYYIILIIEN